MPRLRPLVRPSSLSPNLTNPMPKILSIRSLNARRRRLAPDIQKLQITNSNLRRSNRKLREQNARLIARIAKLIARLSNFSGNP